MRSRELNRKTAEFTQLLMKYNKMTERCEDLKKQMNDLKRKKNYLVVDYNKTTKDLNDEKHKNGENEKKIQHLEKRIELILEGDITSYMSQDKLRKSLTEMMKENENLKRELLLKNKEIENQNEKIQKLQTKVVRLTKKIDSLKARRIAKSDNVANVDAEEKDVDFLKKAAPETTKKDDPLNLLLQNLIPLSLEFRANCLKIEYSST